MLKRLIASIGAALQHVKAAAEQFSGLWVGGDSLQRVLGSRDSDEVLAARLAVAHTPDSRVPDLGPELRGAGSVRTESRQPCAFLRLP